MGLGYLKVISILTPQPSVVKVQKLFEELRCNWRSAVLVVHKRVTADTDHLRSLPDS